MAHGKINSKRLRAYDYDKPAGHPHQKVRRNNRSAQKSALKRWF